MEYVGKVGQCQHVLERKPELIPPSLTLPSGFSSPYLYHLKVGAVWTCLHLGSCWVLAEAVFVQGLVPFA